MNPVTCYDHEGRAQVTNLSGDVVVPPDRAPATIYAAWHAHDPGPPLPCTPLRWRAVTARQAALLRFPIMAPQPPITEGVPIEKMEARKAAHDNAAAKAAGQ